MRFVFAFKLKGEKIKIDLIHLEASPVVPIANHSPTGWWWTYHAACSLFPLQLGMWGKLIYGAWVLLHSGGGKPSVVQAAVNFSITSISLHVQEKKS